MSAGIRAFNLVGRTLATCITCRTYLFIDKLDSLKPSNPPAIVFNVCRDEIYPRSFYTLQALLVEEVLPRVYFGGNILISTPQSPSWTYFWRRPLWINLSISCFKWWQLSMWWLCPLWYMHNFFGTFPSHCCWAGLALEGSLYGRPVMKFSPVLCVVWRNIHLVSD